MLNYFKLSRLHERHLTNICNFHSEIQATGSQSEVTVNNC